MRWLLLSLLAACKFSTNVTGDGGVDGSDIDAPPDAPPDAYDDKCFGAGSLYFCLPAVPTGAETLDNDNTINTGTCGGTNQDKIMIGTTPVCAVIAGTISLSVGEDVSVTGTLPLVLVATTSITINGRFDASSFNAKIGPNANAAQCNNTGIDGTAQAAGTGGGGAGGTFGTLGGNGGLGNATAGGVATAVPTKSPLIRGGCPGGTGMPGTTTLTGPGGNGGGAMYLATHGTISITGTLDVSGGGAGGGATKGGGGGGGSGGMLVMHALSTITIDGAARISANGGGGGGGANLEPGEDGRDPMANTPLAVAQGGQNTMAGRSQGGDGAAGPTTATPGMNGANGGGGGGGGHGLIRVLTPGVTFPAGIVSPTPTN